MKEDEESDSENDLDLCEEGFDQIECENCSFKQFFCHNEEYGEHYYAKLRCKNRLCPKCLIASSPETCCFEFRLRNRYTLKPKVQMIIDTLTAVNIANRTSFVYEDGGKIHLEFSSCSHIYKVTFCLIESENNDNKMKKKEWNEFLSMNFYDVDNDKKSYFYNLFAKYLGNSDLVDAMLDAGLFEIEGNNVVISSSFIDEYGLLTRYAKPGFQLKLTISSENSEQRNLGNEQAARESAYLQKQRSLKP